MKSRLIGLVALGALSIGPPAWSQPQIEGQTRDFLEGRWESFRDVTGKGNVRQLEIVQPGARSLRLHFAEVSVPAQLPVEVVLRGRDFAVLARYGADHLGEAPEFWSAILNTSYVLVEVRSAAPLPTGLRVSISKIAYDSKGSTLLSISEPDARKHVVEFKDNARLQEAARGVVKLAFIAGGWWYSCTGFAISDDLVLTNQHCVGSKEICSTTTVIAGYQYLDANRVAGGEQFRCLSVEAADESLDFAVLRVGGKPGGRRSWAPLLFAVRNPRLGEPLLLIEHPAGEPKQVSIDDCKVTTEIATNTSGIASSFGHSCDTLSGSSGSPVLDNDYRVVGLHNRGFSQTEPRWFAENRAILIELIARKLSQPSGK